jgi:uncharacterized protein
MFYHANAHALICIGETDVPAIEKAICKSDEVNELDEKLNEVFKDALKFAPLAETTRNEQKLWIKKRNECLKSKQIEACLIKEYRARNDILSNIAALSSALKMKDEKGSIVYLYAVNLGGTYLHGNVDFQMMGYSDGKISKIASFTAFEEPEIKPYKNDQRFAEVQYSYKATDDMVSHQFYVFRKAGQWQKSNTAPKI